MKVNELLIVGCGGQARFVLNLANKSEYKVYGLIDLDKKFNRSEVIMGVPVVGCLSNINKQFKEVCNNLCIAIGDNSSRKKEYLLLKEMGFNFPNLIHPSAVIDPTSIIGLGNVIGPNVVIGAEVKIGDNNIINSCAVIEHQSEIGSHNHISLSTIVCGNVIIGNNTFLGANSTVVETIIIPDNTTLGAGGTLLSSPSKSGLTMVGTPAKENK